MDIWNIYYLYNECKGGIVMDRRIYLGASKEGRKYINIWIEGDTIVKQIGDNNIYADLVRQYGKDFTEVNNGKVKSALYGDIPTEDMKSFMKFIWVRDIILNNNINTVTEFKQFVLSRIRMLGGFNPDGADICTLDSFINRSSISRFVNETKKKGVFDQVVVEMPLIQGNRTRKEMVEFIKQNKKAIKLRAVDTLKNSKRFNRYGVPVNFLKYERMVLTRDNVLEITFALKIEAE